MHIKVSFDILNVAAVLLRLVISAVTVSIFGFAVGFGRFFDKNRGSGSVSFFIGLDFNHMQSRERKIIGSVSYCN